MQMAMSQMPPGMGMNMGMGMNRGGMPGMGMGMGMDGGESSRVECSAVYRTIL